ncbi:hypothetical protein [Mesorhizobium onobrychidis]|nr:hypothetical protein [Mesorhizobium onobrychidis]
MDETFDIGRDDLERLRLQAADKSPLKAVALAANGVRQESEGNDSRS